MEEEKGIKDNVEEVKENLQVGPSLTAGAEPREEGSMVLRTEDLVKKYGKRTVVSHVSIDVKQGEIVGLRGRMAPVRQLRFIDRRADYSQ